MPRKHKSSGPATPVPLAGPQRLNKLLAAAGLGSRREVEQYILEGRIEIDGQPVTDLATKVDPETTQLTFDGSAIKIFRPVYFALNKPVGVLSTNRDPSGRMRAIDLINVKERIFSAGRLDRSSEGLMLLTNDGELAQRLSHPRYGIQKLYLATVQGEVTQADLEKLIRGVRLAEGYAKVDAVKLRKQRSGAADLEIALSEGKNREIRRILARLGHKVVGLKRLAIGPLRLGQLPTGGWRPLTKHEIQALYEAATTGRRKKRGTGKPLRKPRTGDEDAAAPVMAAGQFDRYTDDELDEDFGPSLDEMSDDEGDEEMIVLGDELSGTVIPYDDDDTVDDDGGSMEDMFGDEDDDDEFDEDEVSDEDEAPARRAPSPRGSREQSSTRSPHDLRNRNRATGGGRGANSGYQGSRGSRPSGSAPRGAKKTSSRSGSATGPRSSGPRPGGSRTSGGPRTSAPRSGAPRSSSGPRSGSASGGRPTQGGAGRSAPNRSGTARTGTSGPGRGGAGRSGPGRSSGQGGAGRSGPGSSSGPRNGPSRGGPNRGGGQSGPSRGGSSGPSRGGPRSGGPRGGSSRGGPGRSGPSKGRGGGGGKR